MRHAARPPSHPVLYCAVLLVKDGRALFDVEPEDLVRGQPETEPDSYNAACGGPGDQVEVTPNGMFEVLLQTGQERGREYAANSSTIERQDAKCLVIVRPAVP